MELADVSLGIMFFLFVIALLAGLIDTLAGGGGLLTLPALMMSGIPPIYTLGTNKLQSSMGSGTATLMMITKKKIHFKDVKYKMLTAFAGSAFGSVLIQFVDTKALSFVIPIILLIIVIYFFISPNVETNSTSLKMSDRRYRNFVIPAIGCYDGMFGPGTGSFFIMAGVSLKGRGLINSTAIAKSLNFATNIASLIVFLIAGKVIWVIGLIMMAGQFIGARIGAHFLFQINPKYLRLLVIVMCLGMLVKYAITTLNGIPQLRFNP